MLFQSFTHRRVWQEMTGSCGKRWTFLWVKFFSLPRAVLFVPFYGHRDLVVWLDYQLLFGIMSPRSLPSPNPLTESDGELFVTEKTPFWMQVTPRIKVVALWSGYAKKKLSTISKNTTFSYLFKRFCNKVEVITICVTRRPTIIKKCRSYHYKCVGYYKMPRFYKMMQSNVLSSKNFTPVTLRKLFCYSTNSIVTTMLSLKLFNVRLKWLWSQVASASSSF